MTNETTASQPKSIGDDAQFIALMNEWSEADTGFSDEIFDKIAAYLDSNFRAPADQASATIQAAPILAWLQVDCIGERFLCFTKPDEPEETITPLIAATIQEPVMVAEPVGGELHFNAQRLRNVALLVGLTGAIPDDDATLDGARGAVLGMIAGRLRGEAKLDASAVPMVADPAGVARAIALEEAATLCETAEVMFDVAYLLGATKNAVSSKTALTLGSMIRDLKRVSAATVKAVPSEALDKKADRDAVYRKVLAMPDEMPCSVGPTICTIPPAGWHCTRAPGHEGPCAAWPVAAPLADKTDNTGEKA